MQCEPGGNLGINIADTETTGRWCGDQVPMGAAPGACMTAMTLAGTGCAQNDGNFGRITISITQTAALCPKWNPN